MKYREYIFIFTVISVVFLLTNNSKLFSQNRELEIRRLVKNFYTVLLSGKNFNSKGMHYYFGNEIVLEYESTLFEKEYKNKMPISQLIANFQNTYQNPYKDSASLFLNEIRKYKNQITLNYKLKFIQKQIDQNSYMEWNGDKTLLIFVVPFPNSKKIKFSLNPYEDEDLYIIDIYDCNNKSILDRIIPVVQ